MPDNMGFFRGHRESPESEGKDRKPPQEHKPTPQTTTTPDADPSLPSFTVDCFGVGARFFISTQATGPGPIGAALSATGRAANPGDVPNVPGLSERVTKPVPGVN